MTVDEFEREVVQAAVQFAYIRQTVVVDKTANTIKLRLYVTQDCFVQIYGNAARDLYSYTLVCSRQRLYGRDCEGGPWHRHPYQDSASHNMSPEGARPVSPEEFLEEAEQILATEGIL
jgi:hypothetical protein